MGDGSADLSSLVYPRRSGDRQGVLGAGATCRLSRSGISYRPPTDPPGWSLDSSADPGRTAGLESRQRPTRQDSEAILFTAPARTHRWKIRVRPTQSLLDIGYSPARGQSSARARSSSVITVPDAITLAPLHRKR